jgi:hypothetical protein
VSLRRAVLAGATLGGVPSTLHALLTHRDPRAATRAAGTLLGKPSVVRGVIAHALISTGWTLVLAKVNRRIPLGATGGAAAGLLIAALDLGVIGPKEIRALPQWPQWLDHVVFGVAVGVTLRPPPAT